MNYCKSLMQKSFPCFDKRNKGGKGNGNHRQNDTFRQNGCDRCQCNFSRNENGVGNGNDNAGNKPNDTNLENFTKALKTSPKKGERHKNHIG